MKRFENGDFEIDNNKELQEVKETAKQEGKTWVYVVSGEGYDGYCVDSGCTCMKHIHYHD